MGPAACANAARGAQRGSSGGFRANPSPFFVHRPRLLLQPHHQCQPVGAPQRQREKRPRGAQQGAVFAPLGEAQPVQKALVVEAGKDHADQR